MKIYLNEDALWRKMREKDCKTLQELCQMSGASYRAICVSRSRHGTLSIANYWLIADFLDCYIEELMKVDWKK